MNAHPDLKYRLRGLEEYREGRFERALRYFQRASFYADKPSQGMVAEMYWNGDGMERDPALAYAWMDLAAERGYLGFLGLRERYWSQLDEAGRQRAVEVGQEVYARYGDAVAQRRIATVLRRASRRVTGSRTGSTIGNLQIIVPGPGGSAVQIDGSKFYDPRYWDPEQYQAWHDSVWARPRIGRVTVGELEAEESSQVQLRVPATTPLHDAREPELPPDEDP